MTATLLLTLFALLYAAKLALEFALDTLNLRYLQKHKDAPPAYIADLVSLETYQRSIAYTRAKTQTGFASRVATAVLMWGLIVSGAFGKLDSALGSLFANNENTIRFVYPAAIIVVLYVFHLPFSLYRRFSLEQRFGFNKSTLTTFVIDQLKGAFLAIAFGVPLLLLFYWFVAVSGDAWWFYGFLAWTGFQLATTALFPVFLAPMFYKFTPLFDTSLSARLAEIAHRIRFKMAGVFTIDGSKRSAHSNAFFAGFSKTRRVVLFDTLMTQLSEDEIVAVVAHEMGHDKLGHIRRQLILGTLGSLLAFFVLSKLMAWPTFYEAFGVSTPRAYIGFVLFALFAGVAAFPFEPLFQYFSRKHEYEADRFSVKTTGDKEAMKRALKKLAHDNLSNLTPHPWYSFFYYSHPTLEERLAAIDKI